MELQEVLKGQKLDQVSWPVDDDRNGFSKSTLTVYLCGEDYWAVGTTSFGSTEWARLNEKPERTGEKPEPTDNTLGAEWAGGFGELLEFLFGSGVDEGTFRSKL